MTVVFDIAENDYLQANLFFASKDKTVKRAIIRVWLLVPLGVLLLGLAFPAKDKTSSYIFTAILVIVLLIFYPFYIKRRYKQRYRKSIKDNYKTRIGELTIVFHSEIIEIYGKTVSSKVDITEIEEVTETGDYFFAKLRSNSMLIFPKNRINEISMLRDEFKKVTTMLNVSFGTELNWRWKNYVEI
jgi:hypothetical protein